MKLNLKQKQITLSLIHYAADFHHYIKEESIGYDFAFNLLDDWLSNILGLNFKKDIYNNSFVTELNAIEKNKKYLKAIGGGSWFIGDSLKDMLLDLAWKNKTSEEEIVKAEEEIKEMWRKFYAQITSNAPTQNLEPVVIYKPSGITLNGKELYEKVTVGEENAE